MAEELPKITSSGGSGGIGSKNSVLGVAVHVRVIIYVCGCDAPRLLGLDAVTVS